MTGIFRKETSWEEGGLWMFGTNRRACRKRAAGGRWQAAMAGLVFLVSGCELEEVSLVQPQSLLVAEIYVKVGHGPDEVSAFLQRTLGGPADASLQDAQVRLDGPRGIGLTLTPGRRGLCLEEAILDDVDGVCLRAADLPDDLIQPGDYLEVEVSLPGGEELRGGMTLPGDFSLLQPGVAGCALPSGTPLEMVWGPSGGAWAYAGETLIFGLRDALRPLGIQVEGDTLELVGLSVAETDTTLVFPGEFGIFDRFDLDRDLALALQEGLPAGASAEVAVAALDRNYVNWVRGGNFNPSGAVRIPSLRGDGVGVLAGAVRRTVTVVGGDPENGLPPCLSMN